MLRRNIRDRLCTISDLPQEILPSIFKYLSTSERKAVKLVCKSWFEACNAFSLLDEELLNCLGIYQLSDTYELLDRSQRTYLYLKFESVTFSNDSSFWESNGQRIRSIDFQNCHFHSGSLEKIIICCNNLIHLSFKFTSDFVMRCPPWLSPVEKNDIGKIFKSGIVRENLQSLEIYVGDPHDMKMSNYIMSQLFSIFPNVKILKITCDDRENYSERIDPTDLFNKNDFTIAPVLKYLTAATHRMEKLKLHFPYLRLPLQDFLKVFVDMKKLKELSIKMGIFFPLIEDLASLPICSIYLKSLEFQLIADYGWRYHLVLLETFLSYFSNLRHGPLWLVSKAVAEKLISSDPVSFVPHLISQNTPNVLTSLSLRQPEEESLSFSLQNFPNLFHLELSKLSDPVLEVLFKYQLKLKTLIVEKCKNEWTISEDRLNIYKNAFNQLRDVEYLYLSKPVGDIFVKCLSSEPILANLKYLRIEIVEEDQSVFHSDLLRAAEAMPFLESLRIEYVEDFVSSEFLVELCSKLSRLRYFCFMGNWDVKDPSYESDDYRQFFLVCPSLRALAHVGTYECVSYFFDTINKQILMKQISGRVIFGRPKVGDRFIEWLILF